VKIRPGLYLDKVIGLDTDDRLVSLIAKLAIQLGELDEQSTPTGRQTVDQRVLKAQLVTAVDAALRVVGSYDTPEAVTMVLREAVGPIPPHTSGGRSDFVAQTWRNVTRVINGRV
jgi:hypothetical protein